MLSKIALPALVFGLCAGPKTVSVAAQSLDDSCLKEMIEIQSPSKICDSSPFDRKCLLDQLSSPCAKQFGTPKISTDPECRKESTKAVEHCAPAILAWKRECLQRNLTPSCWKQFEAMGFNR